jgi:hypothetical protein
MSPWVTFTSVLRAQLSTRRPSAEHICCNRLTTCPEAVFWILMIRASGRSFVSADAYKSLQMQIIGRRSGLWPVFFSFERAETRLASRSCARMFTLAILLFRLLNGERDQFLDEPRGLTLISVRPKKWDPGAHMVVATGGPVNFVNHYEHRFFAPYFRAGFQCGSYPILDRSCRTGITA